MKSSAQIELLLRSAGARTRTKRSGGPLLRDHSKHFEGEERIFEIERNLGISKGKKKKSETEGGDFFTEKGVWAISKGGEGNSRLGNASRKRIAKKGVQAIDIDRGEKSRLGGGELAHKKVTLFRRVNTGERAKGGPSKRSRKILQRRELRVDKRGKNHDPVMNVGCSERKGDTEQKRVS